MIKRREFFPLATVAAAAVAGSSSLSQAATAACATEASTKDVDIDPVNQSPAQLSKHSIRLPKLDNQSSQDFFSSLRSWMRNASPGLGAEVDALAASQGVNAAQLPMEAAWQLAMTHPTYAARARLNTSTQQAMWRGISGVFHGNADAYLAALAATDRSGPGSLELNPGMAVPEYTRYEIHIQPGGYVGDDFAGAISLHGFKHFDRQFSFNDHQEHHLAMAQETPLPCDGQVRKVLDLGCGWGGLATALKERFPDAEVWGIDVGGAKVRLGASPGGEHGRGGELRAAARRGFEVRVRVVRRGGQLHHVPRGVCRGGEADRRGDPSDPAAGWRVPGGRLRLARESGVSRAADGVGEGGAVGGPSLQHGALGAGVSRLGFPGRAAGGGIRGEDRSEAAGGVPGDYGDETGLEGTLPFPKLPLAGCRPPGPSSDLRRQGGTRDVATSRHCASLSAPCFRSNAIDLSAAERRDGPHARGMQSNDEVVAVARVASQFRVICGQRATRPSGTAALQGARSKPSDCNP